MSRNRIFLLTGLTVALLIAGVASYFASSSPDGLVSTAADRGFMDSAQNSATSGSPLANYGVSGVHNQWLSVGLSGIIGVLVVLLLGTLLMTVVKRQGGQSDPGDRAHADSSPDPSPDPSPDSSPEVSPEVSSDN